MRLPRLVIVLSVVSLLNDAASEMITPLLPVFLTTVLGAGAVAVGLIEGLAEAVASLLKYQGGRLADRGWSTRRLVVSGYGLSCLARPAIGLASSWPPVLALRFLDRAGKGIRTAPRDALISASVADLDRGRAFGFHRSMDHAGAIVGPLLATALLAAGVGMPQVFLLALVPGFVVMALLSWGITEAPRRMVPAEVPDNGSTGVLRWRDLDGRLRGLIVAAGGLALAVTPEAFLVLWATASGVPIALVPLLWSAASVAKSGTAYMGGRLSDRAGRLPLLVWAWSARIAVLLALALLPARGVAVWALFLLYGAALALSEGPERALIGDVAPPRQRATAFGLYHLVYGLLALPGGLLFGSVWQSFGSAAAFALSALLTGAGMLTMLLLTGKR